MNVIEITQQISVIEILEPQELSINAPSSVIVIQHEGVQGAPGASTPPSLPFNSVQFNLAGALGGSSQFIYSEDGSGNPYLNIDKGGASLFRIDAASGQYSLGDTQGFLNGNSLIVDDASNQFLFQNNNNNGRIDLQATTSGAGPSYFNFLAPTNFTMPVSIGNNQTLTFNSNDATFTQLTGINGAALGFTGSNFIFNNGTSGTVLITQDGSQNGLIALNDSAGSLGTFLYGNGSASFGYGLTLINSSGYLSVSNGAVVLGQPFGSGAVNVLYDDGSAMFANSAVIVATSGQTGWFSNGVVIGPFSGSSLSNYPICIGYDGSTASGFRCGPTYIYYDGQVLFASGNAKFETTGTLTLRTGGTAAGSGPIKFTSGSLLTAPVGGTLEFLSDKFYGTISTGTARKEFALCDIALTSGRVCYNTTNGRLTDSTSFTFASGILTLGVSGTIGGVNLLGNTSGTISIRPQAAAGTYNFNLPTTAGSSGQPLLSGGGGAAAHTYGTLSVAFGGTNATSFSNSNGVVVVNSGGTALTSVTNGATNTYLRGGTSGAPSFQQVQGSDLQIGSFQWPISNGGTGQSSYTTGDIIYASGVTSLSKLSDVAVGSYLRSGGVGAAPLWSTAQLLNAYTADSIFYASSTTVMANSAAFKFHTTNGLTLTDLPIVLGTTTGTKIGTATSQKLGFFNATPVVQQTDGATLTNNVTVGGTTNTIADYSDLVLYANDAAAIRNNLYQLARKVKLLTDALRTLGLTS